MSDVTRILDREYGHEIISLVFPSGSFDILGHFEVNPASTPGLANLHEVGTIRNGAGNYPNAAGQVTIQGPAAGVFDPMVDNAGKPIWIAEIHGLAMGIE